MRINKKTRFKRAIRSFDIELKKILLKDLETVRATKQALVDNIKNIHKEIEQHHWTVA